MALQGALADAEVALAAALELEQAVLGSADGSTESVAAVTQAAQEVRAATDARDALRAAVARRDKNLVALRQRKWLDDTAARRWALRVQLLKSQRTELGVIAKKLQAGVRSLVEAHLAADEHRQHMTNTAAAAGLDARALETLRVRHLAEALDGLLLGAWGLAYGARGKFGFGQWPALLVRSAPTLWAEDKPPPTPEEAAARAIARLEAFLAEFDDAAPTAAPEVDPLA